MSPCIRGGFGYLKPIIQLVHSPTFVNIDMYSNLTEMLAKSSNLISFVPGGKSTIDVYMGVSLEIKFDC